MVRDIHEALGVPKDELEFYFRVMKAGRLAPSDAVQGGLARRLSARGMLILDADGETYLPVHPRLAMSNLFRSYAERDPARRKQRRLLVDRITLELIVMLPGETKGTNAGSAGGGAKVKRGVAK
jgi:hypothetical protein